MAKRATLLTPAEVAEHCRVSRWTVENWIRRGYVRATKLPGGLRVAEADLDRFLAERTSGGPIVVQPSKYPELVEIDPVELEAFWTPGRKRTRGA